MEGKAGAFHTVAACHFENTEHIEHWINRLIPKNQNKEFIKWSGGRRKSETRNKFIENCFKYAHEIDFRVNCVSTSEGEMSWFAWSFYMQNQQHIDQKLDAKGRNNFIFKISADKKLGFPVLRAGYLIWYHHVIRYLAEVKRIEGRLISDNFANDQEGPGDDKALGISFLNFLLEQSKSKLRVSLPVTERYRSCDRLSDYFCGWVNSVRSKTSAELHEQKLSELESHPKKFLENIIFATDLNIVDENGNDITAAVREAVTRGTTNDNK